MKLTLRTLILFALVLGLIPQARSAFGQSQDSAQQPQSSQPAPDQKGPGGGRMRGGPRVGGTVTSVGVDQFQIKTMRGDTVTVHVSDKTKYMEGQNKIGLEDLKVGDRVMVSGQDNGNNSFTADTVRRPTAEQMARMQNMGDRAFGQIVSINGNQIKVHNRQGDKTITLTDQTTFMKDGQPSALKDLKVGDRIFASGKEENGQFTADRIMSGQFRRGGMGRRGPGPGYQPQ
jgi:Domain of unknown function (DUF5666)